MSAKSQTLAKSLHTVSVLVNVARYFDTNESHTTAQDCVYAALDLLGYGDAADPYGLAAKAVAILRAGK